MHTIEVDRLTKDYGSGRGVFDVSIAVDQGEVFGFLGPNGAGKSTTIRHLMGFSKPDSGSTKIEGLETFDHYAQVLNHVGYIPGEIALPAGLTGWQFIRMMQDLQNIHNEERLTSMLNLFELGDEMLKSDTKRMSLGWIPLCRKTSFNLSMKKKRGAKPFCSPATFSRKSTRPVIALPSSKTDTLSRSL